VCTILLTRIEANPITELFLQRETTISGFLERRVLADVTVDFIDPLSDEETLDMIYQDPFGNTNNPEEDEILRKEAKARADKS